MGHDKLSIKRLSLKLITDLQLYVMASDQVEGALVAAAVEHDQLLSKYQVRHFACWVNFHAFAVSVEFFQNLLFFLNYAPKGTLEGI